MKNINILCLSLALCCIVSNLNAQCEDAGNYWNKSWVSCEKTLTPNPARSNTFHWLQYEFDEAQSIDSIQVWNANRTGESTMGARNIRVDYSVDGSTWTNNAVNIDIPQATEQDDYEGFQFPSNFEDVFVTKILIVIRTNYGDTNCASIGEVRFNINSDACYGIVDECGECNGPGATTWYMDADGDGLGSPSSAIQDCDQPTGYVENPDDYCDNGLVGWNEVGAIFADNGCTGCHGMGSSGGLKLDTYANAVLGGNKCGPNILTGNSLTQIITTAGYAGCGTPLNGQSMNSRVGGQIDANELALIQTWVDAGAPEDCNCPAGAPDADGDGTCDAIDDCPTFDNSLIGTPCDDGFACTENDMWDSACNCTGIPRMDSDNDGICDAEDAAPNDACTADGTIDGVEPTGWIALPTNDCDTDGINNQNGDLDDFAPCVDNYGIIKTAACQCPDDAKIAGGTFIGQSGVGSAALSSGLPDGSLTDAISGNDYIQLQFPEMSPGEIICFAIGFSEIDGTVNFSINNNSFTYPNPAGLDNYQLQEICIQVRTTGVQDVFIRDTGSGAVKVDGSTFNYCECGTADPDKYNPNCRCPDSKETVTADVAFSNNVNNATNANGLPDGTFSGSLAAGSQGAVTYEIPDLERGDQLCVTMKFNNAGGSCRLNLNGQNFTHSAVNVNESVVRCIEVFEDGLQTLGIFDTGGGQTFIDGISIESCMSCVDIDLHAYLEGTYDPTIGEMTTLLNQRGLLPGQVPVSALATPTPAGQPYSIAPWNYTGSEGAIWVNADYIGNETDWVLVSFRTGIEKSTEVARAAALIQKNGSIYFPDRCVLLSAMPGIESVYVVIEHRNHIGIMTPQAVQIQNNTLTYDFRVNDSYRDPTSFGQKQLPTGEWAMYAGDANQIVDIASYDITGTDKAVWFDNNGIFDYYLSPDFNLDGDVNGQDKTLWFDNNGISSRVPK